MIRIAVVDDDMDMINLFKKRFSTVLNSNFSYITSFHEALATFVNKSFDLYVIDYNLDKGVGLDLVRLLQKEDRIDNRVVLMSARLDKKQVVEAFNLGVSNVIDKPIDFKVLGAILNKNIRMIEKSTRDEYKVGNIIINLGKVSCFLESEESSEEITLSLIEFQLLQKMIMAHERVVSKDALCSCGKYIDRPMSYKALEMHIVSLRKKLKEEGARIKTVRGLGYKII